MKNRLIALLVFLLIILGLFSCKHNDKLKYVFRNSKNLVPIIIYHNFDRNANKKDTSTFDINKFERNLIYLKNNGYNTIFAKDLDKPLPEKPIVITMDDGYMSNYKLAFPLLKKYDMKATIFIIGWSVGAQNTHYSLSFFNWNQAKEMVDSKLIDIESHSYDLHSEKGYSYGEGKICEKGVGKLLNETDEDYIKRVKADYKKIYNLITEHLNYEPKVFAYPYGIYNKLAEKTIKEEGANITFITGTEIADISNGFYLLPRITMESYTDLQTVISTSIFN